VPHPSVAIVLGSGPAVNSHRSWAADLTVLAAAGVAGILLAHLLCARRDL
jgi:hypothetical protein